MRPFFFIAFPAQTITCTAASSIMVHYLLWYFHGRYHSSRLEAWLYPLSCFSLPTLHNFIAGLILLQQPSCSHHNPTLNLKKKEKKAPFYPQNEVRSYTPWPSCPQLRCSQSGATCQPYVLWAVIMLYTPHVPGVPNHSLPVAHPCPVLSWLLILSHVILFTWNPPSPFFRAQEKLCLLHKGFLCLFPLVGSHR